MDIKKGFRSRYFEGFHEEWTVDEDGKSKVIRIYTDNYYINALSDKTRNIIKTLYVLMFIAGSFMYGYAASRRNEANHFFVSELVTAVALFLMMIVLIAVISYCMVNKDLSKWEYRTHSVYLRQGSQFIGGAAVINLVLHLIINGIDGTQVPVTAAYIGAAAIFITMGYIEGHVPYDVVEVSDRE